VKPARLAGACALALACGGAVAAPQTWRVDAAGSRIHWEVEHFGTSTQHGRFDRFDAAVTLDAAAGRGNVSVTVDTASVSSGVPVLDRVLRGGQMLAAADHPQAWFVADRITYDVAGRPRRLDGELTLRGTSRPLVLEAERVDCTPDGAACGATYAATLRRSEHGISFGLPFAADRVRLVVHLLVRRD
jgi:polyisoprenoid-binding protein YceI